MFFRPTPSNLDKAKQAAKDAASNAKEAAENAASAAKLAAGNAAHSALESAHSLLDRAPHIAADVADKVSAKATAVGETLSDARDSVAAKVEAVRHRGESAVVVTPDFAGSMASAQHKAEAARKAADLVNREAERAELEVQHKADAKIARIKREMADKRAEFEHEQALLEERAARLDAARLPLRPHAEDVPFHRPAPAQIEERVVVVPAPPVEVAAPVVEHHDEDDFEYHVVAEKEGGSKLWLIVGGAVFVGAALIYFFKPGSGRRSRAAIKDRLAKVKDDAVDKVTGASDAAPAASQETVITRRAEDLSHRTDEKLAEVIEHLSTPTELAVAQPTKEDTPAVVRSVETYEDAMPAPTTDDLSREVSVASSDAVEGVAVEAYEPLGHIETAATAGSQLDEPHHPNIFDKVAGVVGHVAEVAEHFAGEDKDGAKEKAAEIEAAAEAAKHETKEERESASKKKKGKSQNNPTE